MNNFSLWFIGEIICCIFTVITPFPYNFLPLLMIFFMFYGAFNSVEERKKRKTEKIEIGEDDFAYLVFEKGEIYTNLIKKPAGRYKGKNFKITIKADGFKKVGEKLN